MTNRDWLTDIEYRALLSLFDNFKTAFDALPEHIRDAFYIRLFKTEQL